MRCRRVVFLVPPFWRLMNSHFNGLTLGLHALAEMCREHHSVVLYNADHSDGDYGDWKTIFDSYETFSRNLHPDNPMWSDIARSVADYRPDLVLMTCHGGITAIVKVLAWAIKQVMPNVELGIGGPRVTVAPYEFTPYFDKVCVGPGENVILDLIDGGPGVYSGDENVDMDAVPVLTPDILAFRIGPEDFNAIESSRGCWSHCIFCSARLLCNGRINYRSIGGVHVEAAWRRDNLGVRSLYFVDECFTSMKVRTISMSEMLGHLGLTWTCEVRADTANLDVFKAMKDGGCSTVKVGLEVGTDRMLKEIKKGITLEQVRHCAELLHEVGLPFTVYLMVGFPGMTVQDHLDTLEFAKSLDASHYTVSITAPYPGTELYDMVIDDLVAAGIDPEMSLVHSSDDLRRFWGVPRDVVQAYLDLSPGPKEEVEFERGRYHRKNGNGLYV